jgi:hypothetical protein
MNVAPVMETRVVTRIGRTLALRAPDADVRVEIAGPPDIFTGKRDYRSFVYRGPSQLPAEVATVIDGPRFRGVPTRETQSGIRTDADD